MGYGRGADSVFEADVAQTVRRDALLAEAPGADQAEQSAGRAQRRLARQLAPLRWLAGPECLRQVLRAGMRRPRVPKAALRHGLDYAADEALEGTAGDEAALGVGRRAVGHAPREEKCVSAAAQGPAGRVSAGQEERGQCFHVRLEAPVQASKAVVGEGAMALRGTRPVHAHKAVRIHGAPLNRAQRQATTSPVSSSHSTTWIFTRSPMATG